MSDFVSVIIVNWNGRHHLERCLPALTRQTYDNFEIILVDNHSTDDSLTYVRQRFPDVRLLALEENTGFARGNNVGIQASSAPLIALLNNDTQPDRNWLTALVTAVHADETIGMVASRMLFYDQPHLINSAGVCLDRAGIAWDRLGGQPDSTREAETAVDVFGPCAGAALYRRSLLEQVGLFDEDFFMYLEDVDLAWRAQLAGWRGVYAPEARVLHHHSASAVEGSPFKSRLLGRNKWLTILKNYPGGLLWRYLPFILAYDMGSVLVALLQQRNVHPLIGRLKALRLLPQTWRKRRVVQNGRILSPVAFLTRLEPMVSPARVRQRYEHLG